VFLFRVSRAECRTRSPLRESKLEKELSSLAPQHGTRRELAFRVTGPDKYGQHGVILPIRLVQQEYLFSSDDILLFAYASFLLFPPRPSLRISRSSAQHLNFALHPAVKLSLPLPPSLVQEWSSQSQQNSSSLSQVPPSWASRFIGSPNPNTITFLLVQTAILSLATSSTSRATISTLRSQDGKRNTVCQPYIAHSVQYLESLRRTTMSTQGTSSTQVSWANRST